MLGFYLTEYTPKKGLSTVIGYRLTACLGKQLRAEAG
jgi:hypothetical protein